MKKEGLIAGIVIILFTILVMLFGWSQAEKMVDRQDMLVELYSQCDDKLTEGCGLGCVEHLCEKDGVLYPVLDDKIRWENPR